MHFSVNLTPSCSLEGKKIRAADLAEGEEVHQCNDIYAFLGVPYAEPPTGSLRFSSPRPVSLWNGSRDASQFGAACPQNLALLDLYPFPVTRPRLVSEDCLFLNIWTPSLESASLLPVMVWIHGGGFSSGCSDIYNGQSIASLRHVVVVGINYRVGPLGFMCTGDDAATGNYGILDQIEALRWIQKYIVRFGGNPDNVTIFGESAGGMSVSLLVISPLARGLFRRAIAQSGTVFSGDMIASTAVNVGKYLRKKLAKKFPGALPTSATGSEIIEFLRRQPVDAVVSLGEEFYAVIDGRVLLKDSLDLYASAKHSWVQMLLGSNSDEGAFLFTNLLSKFGIDAKALDIDMARVMARRLFTFFITVGNGEEIADQVVEEYLGPSRCATTASAEELQKILIELIGDILFVIPTIKAAACHSRTSRTFLYHFCHRPSQSKYPKWIRADHGAELLYIFRFAGLRLTEEEKRFSNQILSYWTNFARNGDPNGAGLPVWPEYNEVTKQHMTLQIPMKSEAKLKEQRASFWLRQLPTLTSKI